MASWGVEGRARALRALAGGFVTTCLGLAGCTSDHAPGVVVDGGVHDAASSSNGDAQTKDVGRVPGVAEAGGELVDAALCPSRPEPGAGAGPRDFDANVFGCHAQRHLAPDDWWTGGALEDCLHGDACSYEPGDLPCGACTEEGRACGMVTWAGCDCGAGPFLDGYLDGWVCKCMSGSWDCRIAAPSGEACASCVYGDAGGPR